MTTRWITSVVVRFDMGTERECLLARLGAAKICLKRLNRPQDALRLYEAAETSTVPHLDMEQDIESEINEARTVLSEGTLHLHRTG